MFLLMKERQGETDICYPTFKATPSNENIYFGFVHLIFLPMTDASMQK